MSMKIFLKKLNQEKLFDFLEEYAKDNSKFANAISVRFGKPEFEKELDKIESKIDTH